MIANFFMPLLLAAQTVLTQAATVDTRRGMVKSFAAAENAQITGMARAASTQLGALVARAVEPLLGSVLLVGTPTTNTTNLATKVESSEAPLPATMNLTTMNLTTNYKLVGASDNAKAAGVNVKSDLLGRPLIRGGLGVGIGGGLGIGGGIGNGLSGGVSILAAASVSDTVLMDYRLEALAMAGKVFCMSANTVDRTDRTVSEEFWVAGSVVSAHRAA